MLCSRFLKLGPVRHDTRSGMFHKLAAHPYRRMLEWSMGHRWIIVGISLMVVASSVPMIRSMGVDFLPVEDQSEFEVTVRVPLGSSLEGTAQVMEFVERDIRALPEVREVLTTIGADLRRQVDRGALTVKLADVSQRRRSQRELMDAVREKLRRYPDLVVSVQMPGLVGGETNYDFQFSIQGPDLLLLDKYAGRLIAKLKQMPGMVDLQSTYESGKPEVRVIINRDKAADLNVNAAQVANAMRVLVGGDDQVTTYKEGDDRYDVQLRVRKEFRNSRQALDRLYLPSSTLGNVPLASVASLEPGSGPLSIDRWNRQRRVMINGNLSKGLPLGAVITAAQEEMSAMNMPPEYRSGAVGRSRELGRAIQNFLIAFLLSVVFMYMILAANYESFIDPVTILLSLPLSVPFAVLSLFLARENFSVIYTSLGVLVLFGIVKKNSILQIDHIKGLRRQGISRLDAIYQGCDDRLRPILMTTAALVAGMLPLAFGSGAGAGTRRTVAVVVIGGQSMALLLTLLVTPVAYSIFDDIAAFLKRRGARGVVESVTAVLLVLMLAGAPQLRAQQQPATDWDKALEKARAEFSKTPRVGVGASERRLPLEEALQLALRNNLEIEVERTNITSSKAGVKGARGAFDPLMLYQPGIEARNVPAASSLASASGKVSEHYATNNFYVRGKSNLSGLSYHVDFENQRQSTNNPFVSLNPNFTSRITAGLSIPLWRYRDIDNERAQLKIRLSQERQSHTDFEVRVIDVISRTQSAYWDLAAAIEDAVVAEDGVRLAREQHERNQRQIQAGTLAPVELAASEAELQRRIDTYVTTVGVVTAAENILKTVLTPAPSDALWNDRLVPADRRTIDPPVSEVAQALALAMERRLELRSLDLRLQQTDVQKQLASSATRPQVNLTGNYINSGLAGTVPQSSGGGFAAAFGPLFGRVNELSNIAGLSQLPPINVGGGVPPTFVGGYGQSLSNMFSGNFQTVVAGLQIEWNPRNRTAEASAEQAAVAERRLKLNRLQLQQAITAEVRNSLQGLESARQRIEAARASEAASQAKLESEIRLFQTGESTNFLVLTRQNELIDSRRRVVGASLLLNKAIARLQQALGTTLEANKVVLD
ncbi:MAG: efflux RND transporter permease subunit [Acidobacteria bacterium]|nr:efflux RND transporter permease subunit [Acidobacteriota bacterium]